MSIMVTGRPNSDCGAPVVTRSGDRFSRPGALARRTAMTTTTAAPASALADRVDRLPWDDLRAALDAGGFAVTPPVLDAAECDDLAALFDGGRFRSTIDMARHRFGAGSYRYFDHPLPDPIAALRTAFYRRLAPIANDWAALLGGAPVAFPLDHEDLLERCRAAGQTRPTRSSCATDPATGTRCTRISTATCSSRSRSSPSSPIRPRTSRAASSCSSSSA